MTSDHRKGAAGFLGFNIFHPKAEATIQQWIGLMAQRIRDKPALQGVCLANEPVYECSGRDPYTRPAFTEFLKQKHHSLARLNALSGTGRATLDLNRLALEVTALNTARPRVALLYSQPSLFWEEKYQGTLYSLYRVLNFMGENVTFVSERQLADGTAAKVRWLLLPNATHVLSSIPAALAAFAKSGVKVLLVGKDSLTRDEYDRPLPRAEYPTLELPANDPATAAEFRRTLAPLALNDLRDVSTGNAAWGPASSRTTFSQL